MCMCGVSVFEFIIPTVHYNNIVSGTVFMCVCGVSVFEFIMPTVHMYIDSVSHSFYVYVRCIGIGVHYGTFCRIR